MTTRRQTTNTWPLTAIAAIDVAEWALKTLSDQLDNSEHALDMVETLADVVSGRRVLDDDERRAMDDAIAVVRNTRTTQMPVIRAAVRQHTERLTQARRSLNALRGRR
jgi:hypothetical protein